jgi:glycosyltransferase involved in cell wall biosynthesis
MDLAANPQTGPSGQFVVATPTRSVADNYAAYLERNNRLRFLALGTRRGAKVVSGENTRLFPLFGLLAYAATKTMSLKQAEGFRFHLHPLFDRWVRAQLQPGDHIISSYGYTNASFRWIKQHEGKTFLDAGNSHPENFWEVLTEEHRRWNCPSPPISPYHYRRSCEILEHTDYILAPCEYVVESFLKRGFRREQLLPSIYAIDFTHFFPSSQPRPQEKPLTIINTGSLSLRKGTPYLLEAFREVQRVHPKAKLLLSRIVEDSVLPILKRYQDLNIEWSEPLSHPQLAERLRSADLFVLPSLEEGFLLSAAEALACGVPVITTAHTFVKDVLVPDKNAEIVPIRSSQAVAEAILRWADRLLKSEAPPECLIDRERFSFESAQRQFESNLRQIGLL